MDGLLHIILMMLMGQVDTGEIFTLCGKMSGGWTTEYYIDDVNVSGGH